MKVTCVLENSKRGLNRPPWTDPENLTCLFVCSMITFSKWCFVPEMVICIRFYFCPLGDYICMCVIIKYLNKKMPFRVTLFHNLFITPIFYKDYSFASEQRSSLKADVCLTLVFELELLTSLEKHPFQKACLNFNFRCILV